MRFTVNLLPILLLFFILISSFAACPISCGNGYCNNNDKCLCDPGYFDLDCDVQATLIVIDTPQQGVPENNQAFFYFPITNSPKKMILTFEKPADIEASIWVSVEDNQYFGLPDSSTGSLFPIGSNITSRQIQKSVLKRNIGRKRVFVGVYAAQRVDEITVKASYKVTSTNLGLILMVVLIPIGLVASAPIITCIVLIHCKPKPKPKPNVNPPAASENKDEILKLEEIEMYIPQKEYSEFPNILNQTGCRLCSQEFYPSSLCRKLYCEHIYHDQCIKTWFENKTTCPTCSKSMTAQAIKDFLENVNQSGDEDMKYIQVDKIEINFGVQESSISQTHSEIQQEN